MSKLPTPDLKPRLAQRLLGITTGTNPGLGGSNTPFGATGAVTGSTTYSQVVATAGSARIRVRILTATATGTLNVIPIAPMGATSTDEATYNANGKIDTSKITPYATGTGTVSVSAGTEANVDLDLYGENHCLVQFVCTLSGTIAFVDVSQV